jgi:hypothetical protein
MGCSPGEGGVIIGEGGGGVDVSFKGLVEKWE